MIVIAHRDMPYLDKMAPILDLAAILDFRNWLNQVISWLRGFSQP